MKLAENQKLVRRSGAFEEKEFTMAITSQAFHVMSSTLYSNKIRAIIRELSCNAADAHVVAKNETTPYIIHLPDSIDRSFRIRDFGTGLSKEQMDSVYTQYFNSTKTDTNDQVGCLGLGSKSPFAYTDNFSVSSYFDGKKYLYAAFKNEKGNPSFSLISEEDTGEPNGLEIQFAVRSSDFYRFESEAVNVFKWFNLRPSFEGTVKPLIATPAKSHKGKGWFISNNEGPGALMGNILYNIQTEHLENYLSARLISVLTELKPILEFPVGSLEFQPSRENLSYEKRTIDALKKRLEGIEQQFKDEISSKIQGAKSKWDAFLELEEVLDSSDLRLKRYVEKLRADGASFDWNGEDIVATNIRTLGYTDNEYLRFHKFWFKTSWRSGDLTTQYRPSNIASHSPSENRIYVFVDDSKDRTFSESKFRAWMRGYSAQYEKTEFLVTEKTDKDFIEKFTKSLGAKLGENYFWWHDMPKTVKTRKGGNGGGHGKKRCQAKRLSLLGSTGYGQKDTWLKDYEKVDLEDGEGFYIERNGSNLSYLGVDIEPPYTLLRSFDKLCRDDKKIEKVVTFTPAQMKKKGAKWVNVIDYLKEEVPNLWTDEIQGMLYAESISNGNTRDTHNILKELLDKLPEDVLKTGKNKDLWELVKKGPPSAKNACSLSGHEITYFFQGYGRFFGSHRFVILPGWVPVKNIDTLTLKQDKETNEFVDAISKLYDKQKLLKYVLSKDYYVHSLKDVIKNTELWEEIKTLTLISEGLYQ